MQRYRGRGRFRTGRLRGDSTGLAVLMDLLLPIKDKQITLVHPKAHFRRVFEITGMAGDFEVVGN